MLESQFQTGTTTTPQRSGKSSLAMTKKESPEFFENVQKFESFYPTEKAKSKVDTGIPEYLA